MLLEQHTSLEQLCGDLPEVFDVIVFDSSLSTADIETLAVAKESWMGVKSELQSRNYKIWEYRDEERRCSVAKCVKQPY